MKYTHAWLFFALLTARVIAQEDELFNRLPGVWEMNTGKVKVVEIWQIESQQKLSGKSFIIRDTDSTLSETITIERVKGKLNYIPVVRNHNKSYAIYFRLLPKPLGAFIFENKKHDFPQRIIYRFITDDSLHARIEGKVKRKFKSGDFYYSRTK